MDKRVELILHRGDFEEGGFFASVRIGEEGAARPQFNEMGHLPPKPDIPKLLSQWQESFKAKLGFRIFEVPEGEPKAVHCCEQSAEQLEECLNQWLNSGDKK